MNDLPRVTTDMGAGRRRVRLLRSALVDVAGKRREVAAGTVVMVALGEAERLVERGLAEVMPTAGIVTKGAIGMVHLPGSLTVLKAAGGGARSFGAIASTARQDRQGDVVEPSGWRLDSYRRNPVILLSHDHAGLPVARATRVAVEGGALLLEGRFPEPGASQRADEAGLLGAVSVGFLPLRSEPLKNGTGWRYLEQELLEVSLVSVPANPDALVQLSPLRPAGGKAVDVATPSIHRHPKLDAKVREVARLQREHAPERAAKVAVAAAKAGRSRLAARARELSRMRP